VFKKLSFFGLGKLGLPLAGLFARSGLPTVAIDVRQDLIHTLNSSIARYAEPGLDELLAQAAANITYSTDYDLAAETDVSIILVPTPSLPAQPRPSSAVVETVCAGLCSALGKSPASRRHLVIVSSTVHPGTMATRIAPIFGEHSARHPTQVIDLAYVPDFVALGEIIKGFTQSPLLVVGSDDEAVRARASALYRRIVAPPTCMRFMSTADAEVAKVAYNVFLCMKVSFGNLLMQISDRMGGIDPDMIAGTLALDPKIGPGFLRGGAPFGGPCLPRDVDAFLFFANSLGLDAPLARASAEVNDAQYDLIEARVLESGPRRVTILGLSFKTGTPVTIESPGLEFARRLSRRSVRVVVFDPSRDARAEAGAALGSDILCAATLEESWTDVDAILVCNQDSSFVDIAASVPASVRIIDPWGCVRGSHPGLVRIGRLRSASEESKIAVPKEAP